MRLRDRFAALSPGRKVVAVAVLTIAAAFAIVALAPVVRGVVGALAALAGGAAFRQRSAEAKKLRDAADSSAAAADSVPVHAADRARDAAGAEVAVNAAQTGADDARRGWRRNPHRKPPRVGGFVVFLALSIAPPARAADDNCVSTADFPEPPTGFGFWRDDEGDFYCPCFGRVDQFYDATRVPGGCLTPPSLPLVAYTIGDNAQMWADLESASVRLRNLSEEVAIVRGQRDATADKLHACSLDLRRAADAVEAPQQVVEPPSRATWYGLGAASAFAASLALFLWIR